MSEFISSTESVCPVCLKRLDAERVVGDDGYIHMLKTCPEHGSFDTCIWEGGLESYLAWGDSPYAGAAPTNAKKSEHGCPYDCGLCENHEREGCCVLLEITNRCNLRCPVCFAVAGEGEERDLPLSEIEAQYDMLMESGGPFNIQLSGGEPTMRDDLAEIIALGMEKGFTFFQLNTNGIRIAKEDGYASFLRDAGVSCVFLQFDGLRDSTYEVLRGRPLLDLKMKAIERCIEVGLGVVLVPTVAPGVNEDEIGDIIRFALEKHPAVRGVHFQPISYFGRCDFGGSGKITIPRMLRGIEEQTGGAMKAEDFSGGGAESPYCSFHASYRRSEDGSYKVLPKRQNQSCCDSSEARDFVSRQWRGSYVPGDLACCSEASGDCCGEPEVSDCCSEEVETCCCGEPEDLSCCTEDAGDCCTEVSDCCCGEPEVPDCCSEETEVSGSCSEAADDCCGEACCSTEQYDFDLFDEFIEQAIRDTFTVSGMVFQDASDIDLERLRRCYICEVDSERGMVPFCAYNLSNTEGRALYRK